MVTEAMLLLAPSSQGQRAGEAPVVPRDDAGVVVQNSRWPPALLRGVISSGSLN